MTLDEQADRHCLIFTVGTDVAFLVPKPVNEIVQWIQERMQHSFSRSEMFNVETAFVRHCHEDCEEDHAGEGHYRTGALWIRADQVASVSAIGPRQRKEIGLALLEEVG